MDHSSSEEKDIIEGEYTILDEEDTTHDSFQRFLSSFDETILVMERFRQEFNEMIDSFLGNRRQ